MGLTEIRFGDGTDLKEPNLLPYIESVVTTLSSNLSSDEDSLLKIWEVRKIFETRIMRLASKKMTPQRMDIIKQSHRKMSETLHDRDTFLRHGEQFHRALAETAGNEHLFLLI